MYIYIYMYMVITKSPLSILRHLRVVNVAFLKQRFDGSYAVSLWLFGFFWIYATWFCFFTSVIIISTIVVTIIIIIVISFFFGIGW